MKQDPSRSRKNTRASGANRSGSGRPSTQAARNGRNQSSGVLPSTAVQNGSSQDHPRSSGIPIKNEEVVADIVGIGHEGEGVGRVQGFTLFIPGALPGEKVRAKVLKLKKQYGYAKLLEVLEASKDRVHAPCPIYKQCGGCQLQHLDYAAQLEWKRQLVIDNLERIGKLKVDAGDTDGRAGSGDAAGVESSGKGSEKRTEVELPPSNATLSHEGIIVHPTLGMDNPWRYRNKAQVPIGMEEGGLVGGFYAQGSHRIIDMEACLIQHEANDEVVRRIKQLGSKLGVTAYDETTHSGFLRHVVVKIGFRTGEIMVVLITNGDKFPRVDEWVKAISREISNVASICQNINTGRGNAIFGDRTKVLWGKETITDSIGDVQFAISARSFYQVNPVQTEVLYRKALEYAGLTGRETVIDAYCGIGTISLFLAQQAAKVYGVEIVPEAIADACANTALNGITNAHFAVGAAEDVIPAWREEGVAADVIVVDPPRKGCEPRLLETIAAMRPARVVYVSCNPSTLARDLRILEDAGYRTVSVQPVDMFPHTVHVECVVRIYRDDIH